MKHSLTRSYRSHIRDLSKNVNCYNNENDYSVDVSKGKHGHIDKNIHSNINYNIKNEDPFSHETYNENNRNDSNTSNQHLNIKYNHDLDYYRRNKVINY